MQGVNFGDVLVIRSAGWFRKLGSYGAGSFTVGCYRPKDAMRVKAAGTLILCIQAMIVIFRFQ
jgi:hypothetical protein